MELLGRRRHGRAREEEWAEGGATREGGLWADARGRRKKIAERERGGENEKNRWRTHHRRVILQPGGDMLASPPGLFGTGGDSISPPVRNKPAVMGCL